MRANHGFATFSFEQFLEKWPAELNRCASSIVEVGALMCESFVCMNGVSPYQVVHQTFIWWFHRSVNLIQMLEACKSLRNTSMHG